MSPRTWPPPSAVSRAPSSTFRPTAPRWNSPDRRPGWCWKRAATRTCIRATSVPVRAITTQLGPVPVLLWQTAEQDGGQVYRIMPRASFADYTARWLLDAMTEFAAPEVD